MPSCGAGGGGGGVGKRPELEGVVGGGTGVCGGGAIRGMREGLGQQEEKGVAGAEKRPRE